MCAGTQLKKRTEPCQKLRTNRSTWQGVQNERDRQNQHIQRYFVTLKLTYAYTGFSMTYGSGTRSHLTNIMVNSTICLRQWMYKRHIHQTDPTDILSLTPSQKEYPLPPP